MYRIIFEHHPKEGQEEQFIGALGTKLFRSLDNPKILYAIAEWESKAIRDAIMPEIDQKLKEEGIYNEHEKYIDEVKTIASMELIAESSPSS